MAVTDWTHTPQQGHCTICMPYYLHVHGTNVNQCSAVHHCLAYSATYMDTGIRSREAEPPSSKSISSYAPNVHVHVLNTHVQLQWTLHIHVEEITEVREYNSQLRNSHSIY